MAQATLDRAEFRAWLAAMPGDAVAGICNSRYSCPLAQRWGGLRAGADFTAESYKQGYYDGVYVTPDWAKAFMSAVDRSRATASPITAAECLTILDATPESQ